MKKGLEVCILVSATRREKTRLYQVMRHINIQQTNTLASTFPRPLPKGLVVTLNFESVLLVIRYILHIYIPMGRLARV
jgi:hypothetical protein